MNGPCMFKDDFEVVREHIIPADLVAFATPMYYFGISAQLKTVIGSFLCHQRRNTHPQESCADDDLRKQFSQKRKPDPHVL